MSQETRLEVATWLILLFAVLQFFQLPAIIWHFWRCAHAKNAQPPPPPPPLPVQGPQNFDVSGTLELILDHHNLCGILHTYLHHHHCPLTAGD